MSLSKEDIRRVIASLIPEFQRHVGLQPTGGEKFIFVIDSLPEEKRPAVLHAIEEGLGRPVSTEEVSYTKGPIFF